MRNAGLCFAECIFPPFKIMTGHCNFFLGLFKRGNLDNGLKDLLCMLIFKVQSTVWSLTKIDSMFTISFTLYLCLYFV